MDRTRDEGGFTLFELLIVIIILAILSGLVAFAVGSTRNNSLSASCSSDAKAFGTALEEYKAATGVFPGDTSLQVAQSLPQPLPGRGQTWGVTPTLQLLQLPGTYGLLGNTSTSDGSWTAPNGVLVGPFMRQLPSTQHYQIVTDGQGGVFVYPPSTPSVMVTVNSGVSAMDSAKVNNVLFDGDLKSLNFETDPSICSDSNVVF